MEMVRSRASVALSLFAGIVAGTLTALVASGLQADPAPITVNLQPLNPNGAEGAGFGVALLGAATNLKVNLNAPSGWQIIQSGIRSSGSALWAPHNGNPAPPTASQSYSAYGIGRNDDHSVGFAGQIAPPGTRLGTPPKFDVAVADLQMAGHEITQSDGNGLVLAPSLVIGQFPATLPQGIWPVHTTFTVTPRWKGPPNPTNVGTVTLGLSPGLAVYDTSGILVASNSGRGTYTSRVYPVPPAGLSSTRINIVSNDAFQGKGTVSANFAWDSSITSFGGPTDYLRVTSPTITLCGVGFSGAGYNTMWKNGTGNYTFGSMNFADDGDTQVGWLSNSLSGNPLPGDSHRWHYLVSPLPNLRDPACSTGGRVQHVAAVASITTPMPIMTLRIQATDAANSAASMTGTTQNIIPSGTSYAVVQSDMSKSLVTNVMNSYVTFNWCYDLNDRPTPNVSLGSTSHLVFVTYGTPVGSSVSAKRVDWATSGPCKGGSTLNSDDLPRRMQTAVRQQGAGHFQGGDALPNPWSLFDPGIKGPCVTYAAAMGLGLQILGAPTDKITRTSVTSHPIAVTKWLGAAVNYSILRWFYEWGGGSPWVNEGVCGVNTTDMAWLYYDVAGGPSYGPHANYLTGAQYASAPSGLVDNEWREPVPSAGPIMASWYLPPQYSNGIASALTTYVAISSPTNGRAFPVGTKIPISGYTAGQQGRFVSMGYQPAGGAYVQVLGGQISPEQNEAANFSHVVQTNWNSTGLAPGAYTVWILVGAAAGQPADYSASANVTLN
jgi:hypothetical protein